MHIAELILVLIVLFFIITFFITPETFGQLKKGTHGYEKVWSYNNAFIPSTLDDLKDEYKRNKSLLKSETNLLNFGTIIGRKHFFPSTKGAAWKALQNPEFLNRLERNISLPQGKKLVLNKELPPEYREYSPGSEMKWHRDTIVFDIPQYEVVITLDNTSDSQFMWKYETEPDKFHRANTNTNSVTVVRAGGIKHAVSKVNRGERVIIKACYDVTTSELKSDEGPPGEFNKLTTIPKHPVYPAASV